jgi:septal ring factor EnvC (AmiA/AmiB activator)
VTIPPERRRFSRIQVLEATAASLMAAAILATAGGMGWLVVSLPNRLQQMETQILQVLRNQDQFGLRFQELEKQVTDLDRRTIRLELNR